MLLHQPPEAGVPLNNVCAIQPAMGGEKKLPAYSVLYHPEASPGPHDARYLFEGFVGMMGG